MFNSLTRLNNLSALISSALFTLIGLITLSSLSYNENNNSNINITQLNVVNSYNNLNQFAFIRFEGVVDTTSLFDNWNTKQVFVQLSTDYNTQNTHSSTVIWDAIITNGDILNLDNVKQKYSLKSKSFEQYQNTTLSLTYHIQPYVGLNKHGLLHTQQIQFPKAKSNI